MAQHCDIGVWVWAWASGLHLTSFVGINLTAKFSDRAEPDCEHFTQKSLSFSAQVSDPESALVGALHTMQAASKIVQDFWMPLNNYPCTFGQME